MGFILFITYMFEFIFAFLAGSVVYFAYGAIADAIIRFKLRKQARLQ